ncbi:STAS domain-containing protein [Streptomyces sp. NPDC058861]|uniref:STAS domain-containing protein n=1 Tax=Streptomyces sp. NPDC058861 TaxID=3346653 RepID=UPI00369C6186
MHAVPERKVRFTSHEQVFVITMHGEMDHDDAEDVEAAWAASVEAASPMTAVDLSRVTFADSMLLNALLEARRRHEADGRELVLIGPLHSAVRRLLDVSGTLDHFRVVSTGPSPAS